MYTQRDVAALVDTGAFERGSRYADGGMVREHRWSEDGATLRATVSGTGGREYDVQVRMRAGDDGPRPSVGLCSCPVGRDCKHVAAALLAVADEDRAPASAPSGWRSALDPLLVEERRTEHMPLGLVFELLPGQGGRQQAVRGPSRTGFRTLGGRPAAQRPRIGVRPVRRNERGRWVRTGVSWRDVTAPAFDPPYAHDQLEVARELHGLLDGQAAIRSYTPDTWVYLERCRTQALWAALGAARDTGLALLQGERADAPLDVADIAATPSIDVSRTDDGLALRSRILLAGDAGADLEGDRWDFIGDPAVGVATWTGSGADASLRLVPFDAPLASNARTFVRSERPILIPAEEESAFLVEHYPRLGRQFAFTSTDGSFAPPEVAAPRLRLTIKHAGRGMVGRWSFRYLTPGARGDEGRTLPLVDDGTPYRDTAAERRVLDAVLASEAVIGTPALRNDVTGSLAEEFELGGMDVVRFAGEALRVVRAIPDVEVVERGEKVDYRPANAAPAVSVGTRSRAGDRDWFDLDIDVTVDGERVPLADLFRALAAGDDAMVLPGGVYFALDDDRFGVLRDLLAEARSLAGGEGRGLTISRFQSSLWEDLQAIAVVDRQADEWRRSIAALGEAGGTATVAQTLPDGFTATLRPYQQAGYDWLAARFDAGLGGVLADDMGLGKTVQALALIARGVAEGGRFLVVAPTSVVSNWVREAERFAPDLRTVGMSRTSSGRAAAFESAVAGADLVITSYALLRLDADAYRRAGWAGVLLDEAQFVKNRHSATYRAVRELGAPFVLAVTGTPLENGTDDLWSILSIVSPGLFPSPAGFVEQYGRPIERDGDQEALAKLRRRIRPFVLRRTKAAVAPELPPRQEQIIEVELDADQRRVYDTYLARERQRVLGLMGEFDRNRFTIFQALTTLRQVALDAALVDSAHEGVPSAKLDLLDTLLADALAEGHRVLVFSQFTRFLRRVRDRLDGAGVDYAYLDGTTTRRDLVVDRFRSGEAGVFLISLKAGGFGLNLTEADYCILLDPWWNPAAEAQAVDRAHRIGQTRSVLVYRLVAKDTVEDKVMALKAQKAELFASVMSGTEQQAGGGGITAEDVRELLG